MVLIERDLLSAELEIVPTGKAVIWVLIVLWYALCQDEPYVHYTSLVLNACK